MGHHGLLGDYRLQDSGEDIRGTALYGWDDEKLGKIKDVIFDHSTGDISYVVVDTGGWLSTKEFLVPATRLRSSTKHENDFESDLTKKQIENFPPYNKKDLESPDKWADYEDRYRSKWEADPVMHREGTDRNITPTTQQLEGNQASLRAAGETQARVFSGNDLEEDELEQEEDVIAASTPTERVVPAGEDSVVISSSASGIGPRWDTFQDHLRERRKQAATSCSLCSVETASSRDRLKRAG